jgi:hypothetical protein
MDPKQIRLVQPHAEGIGLNRETRRTTGRDAGELTQSERRYLTLRADSGALVAGVPSGPCPPDLAGIAKRPLARELRLV